MARKNEYGRYIISAGEVGAFIVCPAAWKLRMVDKIRAARSARSTQGRKLHDEWAEKYGEALNLWRGVLSIISLIALATIIFALMSKL